MFNQTAVMALHKPAYSDINVLQIARVVREVVGSFNLTVDAGFIICKYSNCKSNIPALFLSLDTMTVIGLHQNQSSERINITRILSIELFKSQQYSELFYSRDPYLQDGKTKIAQRNQYTSNY